MGFGVGVKGGLEVEDGVGAEVGLGFRMVSVVGRGVMVAVVMEMVCTEGGSAGEDNAQATAPQYSHRRTGEEVARVGGDSRVVRVPRARCSLWAPASLPARTTQACSAQQVCWLLLLRAGSMRRVRVPVVWLCHSGGTEYFVCEYR